MQSKMSAEVIRLRARQQYKRATAYTLVKDMKWILSVLKVLGILPIFKIVHAYKIALPQGRSFATLYTSLVQLFDLIAILLYIYIVYSPIASGVIFTYGEMDNVTIALQILLGIISSAIVLWKSVRKSQNFIIIINQLLTVDKELQHHLHAPAALENSCAPHERYTWLLFVHTVTVCVVKWLGVQDCTSSLYCVGLYFLYHQLHAIINSYVIFVATMLHLLAVRFRYLNDFIKIYTMLKHDTTMDNVEFALKTFSADMLFFYRTHNKLLAIFKKLNEFVHTALLAFIAYFFYTSTLSVYQFYLVAKLDEVDLRSIVWCVVFLFIHAPIAALLMRQSDAATKEANATSSAVARIYGRDIAQQKLIDKFLTKSIKQDVQFTAYGFFIIDKSTLFKIVSAITAYLVILIQFRQLEDARAEAPTDEVYNKAF